MGSKEPFAVVNVIYRLEEATSFEQSSKENLDDRDNTDEDGVKILMSSNSNALLMAQGDSGVFLCIYYVPSISIYSQIIDNSDELAFTLR